MTIYQNKRINETEPAEQVLFPGSSKSSADPVRAQSDSGESPYTGNADQTPAGKIQEMPYERFLSCGAGSLTNAELLAIILRTGTREKSATQLSREILGFYDSGASDLSALHRLTKEDLMSIPGIGEVKAVKILSLAEISRRLVREQAARRLVFSSPSSVADYYMEDLRHLETETAILVLLDNKLALLREEILSLGTVNCTLLSPREIFLRALRWGAVNIMLLHNHPSGDPTPSRMDLEVTERISRVGKLLGIHLIDHLVIGDLSYTSLREYGCITDRDPAADSGAEWTQEEPVADSGVELTQKEPVADSDAAHAERKQRDPVPGSDDSGAQQTREDRICGTGEAVIFDTD